MPHLVLAGGLDLAAIAGQLEAVVWRFERAILKTEERWLRADGGALLVEAVVVEFTRPLHPVAIVAARGEDTVIRLWSRVPVERTRAVQRWLCLLARELQRMGAGELTATNIPVDLWSDLELQPTATAPR